MKQFYDVCRKIFCLLIVGIFSCIINGCSPSTSNTVNKAALPLPSTTPTPVDADPSKALFRDVAATAGISFTHIVGDSGKFYFVELTAPGCAFLDYDNDGDQDVFLVQSGSSAPPSTVKSRPYCALFRNKGDGTFVAVTAGSGLDKNLGYAQGVAVGDYDNDGYDDLFVTAYAGNHLFRNLNGSGRFEDVTKKLGLGVIHGDGYATSAAWGDYDNDGRLDLYVCYYAEWTHAKDKECPDKLTGLLDYCHPEFYKPVTHRLYHNTPNGFVDVSEKSGIAKAKGRGLAVAWNDYNQDGKPDIFVANDVTPGMLWRNNGNGTFSNVASAVGVAYDGNGEGIAGMGIAIADYNRSGRLSFYVSNFSSRPNILFKNDGTTFEDATVPAQLAFSNLKFLTFGCEFFDYDADSWPDIITNNGHVQMRETRREVGIPQKQRKQLFRNLGKGTFTEIADSALLGDLMTATQGRGLATGDYDNDGRIDILAMSQNAPAQLFHNQTRNDNHWISFHTIGTKSNRDGIHARIEVEYNGIKQVDIVHSGSSYLSSSDRRVYFGVGAATKIDRVTIIWPSGQRDILRGLDSDNFYTVTEGRGVTKKQTPQANLSAEK